MCRWLAYDGPPVCADAVLFGSAHSIVQQSIAAREGVTPVNGDGFGIAWYPSRSSAPRRYRSTQPAWNDVNLQDVASELRTSTLLAHVRASSGTAVQQSNCHPFQHGRWSFVHNGELRGFERYRRALLEALDDEHFAAVAGTTDSELLFHLALQLGVEAGDVLGGLERAVGLVESVAAAHGVEGDVVQATIGLSGGDCVHAVRYASTDVTPRTLYHTTHEYALQEMVPGHARELHDGGTVGLVVSEPLTDLPGEWATVAPDSYLRLQAGIITTAPFAPRPPDPPQAAPAATSAGQPRRQP